MWLRREAKLKKHSLDPIETSCRLVRHDHLDSLADDEQALLEHFDLVLPREVLRSVLELFLEREIRSEKERISLVAGQMRQGLAGRTKADLTGRSSSLASASSIEALKKRRASKIRRLQVVVAAEKETRMTTH